MYYRDRRGSYVMAGGGEGGGTACSKGFLSVKVQLESSKRTEGIFLWGPLIAELFSEGFFSPNALRPDPYLLLVINLCFDDKNMFVNIQPTSDTTLCIFRVEHTPCECTFTS